MKKFMKKLLSAVGVLALACTSAFASVDINAANFPDSSFRSYVSSNFDKNSDGKLSDAEIAGAVVVDIYGKGTMKLTGIEHLRALKRLICNYSLNSGKSFNFTSFKSSFGLKCDIDDSYLLMIYTNSGTDTGLMTPFILDIADTSSGSYVLKFPLYGSQTADSISFITKGEPIIEIHVYP